MKRYGGLWEQITSWPNLVSAAEKAQKGKRSRAAVERFNFHQERELLRLQAELKTQSYVPGEFRSHWITRPKPRLISAAPYRDRVVHFQVFFKRTVSGIARPTGQASEAWKSWFHS